MMKSQRDARLGSVAGLECEVDELVSTGDSQDEDYVEEEKEECSDQEGMAADKEPRIAGKENGSFDGEHEADVGEHPAEARQKVGGELAVGESGCGCGYFLPGGKTEDEHAVDGEERQ